MIYNPLLLRALILGSLLYASAPKGSYMGQSEISVRMRGVSFLLAGLMAARITTSSASCLPE